MIMKKLQISISFDMCMYNYQLLHKDLVNHIKQNFALLYNQFNYI